MKISKIQKLINLLFNQRNTKTIGFLLTCLWLNVSIAHPPIEAFEACKNKNINQSCSIHTRAGKMEGQCQTPRLTPSNQSNLVCVLNKREQLNRQKEINQSNQSNSNFSKNNQRQGILNRPPPRSHNTTQSSGISQLIRANINLPIKNEVNIYSEDKSRVIESNGIPNHPIGRFPNHGNPHQIAEQNYRYRIALYPQPSNPITPLKMHNFGIAVNGVVFDPAAAEWYLGHRNSDWQYEPLSGAIDLGLDTNYAHIQPNGAYHYHALPVQLLEQLGINENQHSALVGYAADGFPIYALYGYEDPNDLNSKIIEMESSYQLKQGTRANQLNSPKGKYDGTFTNDYHYIANSGTLDECNGRITKTKEYPSGTYAYFLTKDWPVIPRCFKASPSRDFTQRR